MLVAMAVLVVLILLMSGSSGGLFARKLVLRSYFDNASGLKPGARLYGDGARRPWADHAAVMSARSAS